MVAARIVERDPATGTHVLPPEHAHWLSRQNPTENMAIFAQYVSILGGVEDQILRCFREGGGVLSVRPLARRRAGLLITGSEVAGGLVEDGFAPRLRESR